MQQRQDFSKIIGGMRFGYLTVIQRVADNPRPTSPNLKKRVRVECVCGHRETIPTYYLIRPNNPKQHCGCKRKTIKTHNATEYRCWMMMHYRTENPKHNSYEHYRKRNIRIDPLFHKDRGDAGFEAWLKEMGPRPSKAYSCDRIDNTKGYIPGNIRWATAKQQRANQGNTIDGKPISINNTQDCHQERVSTNPNTTI